MNRLSDALASSHATRRARSARASSPGDRRHLREWAEAARRDAENTLNDLDSYPQARLVGAALAQPARGVRAGAPGPGRGRVSWLDGSPHRRRCPRAARRPARTAPKRSSTRRRIAPSAPWPLSGKLVEDALGLYPTWPTTSEPTRFWDHGGWAEHQDQVFPIGEQPPAGTARDGACALRASCASSMSTRRTAWSPTPSASTPRSSYGTADSPPSPRTLTWSMP